MIKFDHVSKNYENGVHALRDMSFEIEDGEFVFLIGSSGAGKSTIIKLIMKEENPTSGNVYVNGMDLADLKTRDLPYLRRGMGIVFQDFRLLPKKTVYENVAFAMEIIGAPAKEIKNQVPMVLAIVGLSKKKDSFPSQLSGGEQQRVALARSIINAPSILIADEPTGNLDPTNSLMIMNLLKEINQKGTTVLITTHEKELVNTMGKRVIEIKHGSIVRDDSDGGYENDTY